MTKEFCRHCGAEAPEGAQNCAVCGARLSPGANDANSPVTEAAASDTSQPATHTGPSMSEHYAPYPAAPDVWAPPSYPPSYHPGAPGYPTYPGYPGYPTQAPQAAQPMQPAQAGQAPYQPYPSATGYPQQVYGYPMGGYYASPYAMQPKPRRAPGEVYALVIAWVVTGMSGLAIAGGLLVTALASLGVFNGQGDDLSYLGGIIGFSLAPIVGGGLGLWYGILGIRRRPSPRFGLPPAWLLLALAVLAVGGGVALWQYDFTQMRSPGTAFGILPLAFLAGALPALAILAFATQRLHNPSTRRHVWMSLFYGMSLAPLLAVILELILSLIIVAAFHLSAQDAQSVLGQPNTSNPSPSLLIAMLLVLSVVAPLVEEGVKPLAALLIIRRLRTPAEAFLVGLAAGVGFDMFETIGYIGQGQADWVSVAIDRIGAGLLHGVGAGMGALAWYYLINGSGVRLRWLRAIGCGLYAILQHSIFNALSFASQVLPSTISDWMNQPFYLGGLPLQNNDLVYLVAYLVILGVLFFMTGRLWRAKGMPERKPPIAPTPHAWPAWPAAPYGYYAPFGPFGPPAQFAPGGWPAPAPIPQTQQPMGGAR